MPIAKVHRISAASPDDVSGIARAIETGAMNPRGILAVFGKTEGNGCVNDFSRGFATLALSSFFAGRIGREAADRICYVMSGGTEGGMAPHWTLFERTDTSGPSHTGGSLAIGRAHTPALPAHGLGRRMQIEMVADGVRAAMADAKITDRAAVHFVQVKCPLLTMQRIEVAHRAGKTVATPDTLKSMGLSRAASALGVAVALDELAADAIPESAIGTQFDLWSGRASCSAGIELLGHEIVVIGMSDAWSGHLAVDHAVMQDAIDVEPVREALMRLKVPAQRQLAPAHSPLLAVLAKAEASHDGLLRGHRHTMLDDSDISSTRHARAFVCGALAGVVGHAEIYVSGGAEHQGPDGGGPVALLVDRARIG
jgi:cyanuric acid amidohydrolase